jgi:hypothetical protein
MEIDAGPMMVIEALKPAVFVWGSVRRVQLLIRNNSNVNPNWTCQHKTRQPEGRRYVEKTARGAEPRFPSRATRGVADSYSSVPRSISKATRK